MLVCGKIDSFGNCAEGLYTNIEDSADKKIEEIFDRYTNDIDSYMVMREKFLPIHEKIIKKEANITQPYSIALFQILCDHLSLLYEPGS